MKKLVVLLLSFCVVACSEPSAEVVRAPRPAPAAAPKTPLPPGVMEPGELAQRDRNRAASEHYGPVGYPMQMTVTDGAFPDTYKCQWWAWGSNEAEMRLYSSTGEQLTPDMFSMRALDRVMKMTPAEVLQWCGGVEVALRYQRDKAREEAGALQQAWAEYFARPRVVCTYDPARNECVPEQ
jgi:hypothetical protein